MKNLLAKIVPTPGSTSATVLAWAACLVVAGVHSWTLSVAPYQAATVIWVFPLLVIVPGLVSMLVIPGEWKHWYRWLAIVALTYSSYAEFIAPIVFIGTAWSLHRTWVTERKAPLRSLLAFRRTATAPEAKGSRPTKTA
jgi:cell division protein FtsW (lipid II flippase)